MATATSAVVVCLIIAFSQEALTQNVMPSEPPMIEEVSAAVGNIEYPTGQFKVLQDLNDYIIVGSISGSPLIKNRLKCKASNADSINWEYRVKQTDSWGTTLPSLVEVQELVYSDDRKFVSSEINDGEATNPETLAMWNGYYACVAKKSSTNPKKSRSLPVRVIIPYVKQTSIDHIPVPGFPKVNESFSIPCFQNITNQLVPQDAAEFIKMTIKWERRIGGQSYRFPDEYDNALDKNRIKVHLTTGALYYTYIIPQDSLPSEEVKTAGGPLEEASLQCFALVGGQSTPLLMSHYIYMDLTAEPRDRKTLEILYPPHDEIDGKKVAKKAFNPRCIPKTACRIPIIFGGEYGAKGIVRATYKNEILPLADFSGFELTGPADQGIYEYVVELYDEEKDQVLEELHVNVEVAGLPRLLERFKFPHHRCAEQNEKVIFICPAEYSEENAFHINGKAISQGSPSFVSTIGQDGFIATGLPASNYINVQCISANQYGFIESMSALYVYASPNVTLTPPSDRAYHIVDRSTEIYSFTCLIALDETAKDISVHWESNRLKLEHMKVTLPDDYGVEKVSTDIDNDKKILRSKIDLRVTPNTTDMLTNTSWTCVVTNNYLLDDGPRKFYGEPFKLIFPTKSSPDKMIAGGIILGGLVVGIIIFLVTHKAVKRRRLKKQSAKDKAALGGRDGDNILKD